MMITKHPSIAKDIKKAIHHWKVKGIDLSKILYVPDVPDVPDVPSSPSSPSSPDVPDVPEVAAV